jgi:hypothetical protein
MDRIENITINLHAGSRPDVVYNQQKALEGLSKDYEIEWNLRIKRYPHAYPSFSQLMNHAIVTSKHEWMIFINDRTNPTEAEARKMIKHMEEGFACSFMYNVGYMMFSKELIRKIGWWDERFLLGGWEDRDFVYRLSQTDLALYESQEASYDYNWKSPLQVIGHGCKLSEPHWNKKYEQKYQDAIVKMLPEEKYPHWDLFLGSERKDISLNWKPWKHSLLGICYNKPNSGPPGSFLLKGRKIYNYEEVKDRMK